MATPPTWTATEPQITSKTPTAMAEWIPAKPTGKAPPTRASKSSSPGQRTTPKSHNPIIPNMKTKPAEPPTGGTHLAQASLPDTIQKINGALRALLCLAIGLLAGLGRCPGQGFEFVNDSGSTATVWYYYHVISCGAGGYGWVPPFCPCITSGAPGSNAGIWVAGKRLGCEGGDGGVDVFRPD